MAPAREISAPVRHPARNRWLAGCLGRSLGELVGSKKSLSCDLYVVVALDDFLFSVSGDPSSKTASKEPSGRSLRVFLVTLSWARG
jgi:hypothetical protein